MSSGFVKKACVKTKVETGWRKTLGIHLWPPSMCIHTTCTPTQGYVHTEISVIIKTTTSIKWRWKPLDEFMDESAQRSVWHRNWYYYYITRGFLRWNEEQEHGVSELLARHYFIQALTCLKPLLPASQYARHRHTEHWEYWVITTLNIFSPERKQ